MLVPLFTTMAKIRHLNCPIRGGNSYYPAPDQSQNLDTLFRQHFYEMKWEIELKLATSKVDVGRALAHPCPHILLEDLVREYN